MASTTTVEQYLAAVPKESRAALEQLRKAIRAAAPGATESISYQILGFRHEGRMLVWCAGFKDHTSLYPATGTALEAHGKELKPYLSGKGTLRFGLDKPIPVALVKKVVKARIKDNAARARR